MFCILAKYIFFLKLLYVFLKFVFEERAHSENTGVGGRKSPSTTAKGYQ